ncbi:hypothetical protein Tco_1469540 [Tanacetum coccineum]
MSNLGMFRVRHLIGAEIAIYIIARKIVELQCHELRKRNQGLVMFAFVVSSREVYMFVIVAVCFIMGKILWSYVIQNQRDCFTNDTFRGRSLVSSDVYYEVAPQVVFRCVVIFGGVTSYLDKSSNTISDLYKGLNIITELIKEIKNDVKDDSVINKKINEATESFTKFSTNITDLQSSVNTLQAHALKQDEELAAWAKSSTNMARNLRSRLSGLERAQNHIQSSMSSLKKDTHSIKTMMSEMYEVFKGQSSGSVTPTLSLTHILANIEGENATNTATEEPPSHTKGETNDQKLAI